jgi:hypothetical protein
MPLFFMSKKETRNQGKCAHQPFARHVVAGEDARARFTARLFTGDVQSSHILSPTDYARLPIDKEKKIDMIHCHLDLV